MQVAVCRIVLHLPQNRSLKGKRRIVQSVMGRLRSRFNVAVAEVEDNDLWQQAVLGVSCVSNNGHVAQEVLAQVAAFVQGEEGEYQLVDYQVEVIPSL